VYAYNSDLPPPSAPQPSASPEIDIWRIIGILRRRWLFPVAGCLIGLAVGIILIIAFVPTLYKSSARILIDRSANRYLQAHKIADGPAFDDMETGSQIYVLSSESIVLSVVRSMNLADDPEFITPRKESEWGVKKLLKAAMQYIGWTADAALDPDTSRERVAVETFLKRLTVGREDVANVINVTFASKDPQQAAKIANAVADNYLAATLKAKLESSKIASQLLQDRLMELRRQLNDADQVLREYRLSSHVTSSHDASNAAGIPYFSEMSSLNSQLINTRIALIESKARLEHSQRARSEGAPPAPLADNAVITKLRSQYVELGIAAAEMEGRVGANHGAVVKLRERMDKLRAAIDDESQRISGTNPMAMEHELAKARYDELSQAYNELVAEARTNSQARLTLRDLESSVEALRSLYNSSLQKYNEMSNFQPQPIPIQDARIITRAAPPLNKDLKKPLAALGGSIALGLLLGAGAALARELAGGAFRTPGQVKSTTDVYCGITPAVRAPRGKLALYNRGAGTLEEYVLEAPYSRFAETVRNIKVLVDGAHRANGDRVFCVVSSVANEGKTMILTNLAALMAVSSRVRLLVIDCDLHRRRLTSQLAPDAREGLIEALEDSSRLSSLVCKRERSGLDFLPCALSTRHPNAAELLGSRQMEKLLDAAREAYEFVIIEVPPIMSVVDIKMIERFIDRFIFVVEWGKTTRRAVQEALSEAEMIRDRLICVVLNKADPAALRSIEGYKGAMFGTYYDR
jgi:polysaccharide biosynthesis transport protein